MGPFEQQCKDYIRTLKVDKTLLSGSLTGVDEESKTATAVVYSLVGDEVYESRIYLYVDAGVLVNKNLKSTTDVAAPL